MKRLLQALMLCSALVAGAAFAHAELSQSVPADQAALDAAPKEVMLHLSEAVRLTSLSLKKEGGAASDPGPLPIGTNQHFAGGLPRALPVCCVQLVG